MTDAAEFDRWRIAAADARRAAETLSQAGGWNWSCFLAEQAAQLAVKGLLHGIGVVAWGHDLVRLGEALGQATSEALAPDLASACRRLSRHYIPARYPDAHPGGPPGSHYGNDDALEALRDVDRVLAAVDQLWARIQRSAGEER